MTDKTKPEGLDLMRVKFAPHLIAKLPKPTKKQTDDLRAAMNNKDFSLGIRCKDCGGWHHKDVIHLDYVGHAALTDRLLDCDPNWNWEPLSFNEGGNPQVDSIGGMWIKLTVCGVTRLGYGSAEGKKGGDTIKEIIGDALRNAAMRFGAALDLWHKGDLHDDSDEPPKDKPVAIARTSEEISEAVATIEALANKAALESYWKTLNSVARGVAAHPDVIAAKDRLKVKLATPKDGNGNVDSIPY